MDIVDAVNSVAKRVLEQVPYIQSEEATKLAMINPFIRDVLDYDTTDLTQVQPEYTADVGIKQGEKVDYALIHEGEPLILIEAKVTGTPLDKTEPSQLFRYFATLATARFGIYTDGVKYLFFTDIDNPNVMDHQPFLVLDLSDVKPEAVEQVARFVRSEFDPDAIRDSADALKYVEALQNVIDREFHNPSDEFVRFLMTDVYEGPKTQRAVETFRGYTEQALKSFVEVNLRARLTAAFGGDVGKPKSKVEEEGDAGVTDDELRAFLVIKALLHDVIDVGRLHLVDRDDHCSVLVDGSSRKPICHLRMRKRPFAIDLMSIVDGKRQRRRARLQSIDDIYVHEPTLEARTGHVLNSYG